MTNTRPETIRTVVAGETYRGHDIAIVEHRTAAHHVEVVTYTYTDRAPITVPARDVAESVQRSGVIDGQSFRCPAGTDTASLAKLRKYVDVQIADDAIRGCLTALIGNVSAHLVEGREWQVGDVAAVYAMGRNRRGLVTKVARTRVEVAYTTASSAGRIFRKSVPAAEVRVVTA